MTGGKAGSFGDANVLVKTVTKIHAVEPEQRPEVP